MRLQRKLLRKCSRSGIRKQVLLSTNNGQKNRKWRSGEDSQFSYGSVIAVTFHRGLGLCSDLGCSALCKRPGKGVRREVRELATDKELSEDKDRL